MQRLRLRRGVWWLSGLLLIGMPEAGRAETGAVAYPELQSPFGVNRVFDYSEEQAELQRLDAAGVMRVIEQRDLVYVGELGLRHYRVRPGEYAGFAWDRMDPTGRGEDFDFSRVDALVGSTQGHGLNVLPVLAPRARPVEHAEQGGTYVPRTWDTYLAWVSAVVERYDGDGTRDMPGLRFAIREWQIGDVPDSVIALRDGKYATADDYVRLLERTSSAIRRADDRATIVLGAVTSAHPGSDGLRLLETVLASEAASRFDVLAFEYLPRTLATSDLQQVILNVKKLAGGRPLWCTLAASYSRYTPRNAMTDRAADEETQAASLVRRYAYMMANGVQRIYEAGITEEGPDSWKVRTFFSGLRNNDGAAKRAYSSYRMVIRLLGPVHLELSSVLSDGQNDIFVLQFRRKDSPRLLYLLWWDYAATTQYKSGRLEPDVATQVTLKLTDERVEIGEMVQDTVGRFNTAVVRPQEGILNVPLRRVPVMLRAKEDSASEGKGQ